MFTTKELVKDKFWIVEASSNKIGTIRKHGNLYEFFDQRDKSTTTLDTLDGFKTAERKIDTKTQTQSLNGYPTNSGVVIPITHDSLPLFRKTEKGKTILLQFDVHTGRPYSRINKIVGTKAVHDGYPSQLYIEGEKPEYWGHNWLKEEAYNEYKSKYQHPIIKKLKTVSQGFKQGHGGMDFVMIYRLIKCLNLGLPLDINVYDSILWSAITPLSELSVAANSQSIIVPDFTGGTWKKENALEIMREV